MDNIIKIISVIGTIFGIIGSIIAIIKFIRETQGIKNNKNINPVHVKITKKKYDIANVNNSVVTDSYNGSFNTYNNSGNNIMNVKVESQGNTSTNGNALMYLLISFFLIPIIFYFIS